MRIQYCKNKGQHYNETDANPQYNNDPCYLKGEHDCTGQAWEALSSSQSVAVTGNNNFFRGANMQGLHIKLVFRDDDGKGESTFDFPEGFRIGFFSGTAGEADKFYLSNAALNFYLFSYNYTQLGYSEDEQTPMTLPTAARFSFNGGNYLGMETERDFDLNDLVFRISNAEPAPDITPRDFPKEKEVDPDEWIIACEDMGSYNDYDFNDVVLKVGVIPKKEEGDKIQIKITPIACGGTLDSYVSFRTRQFTEIHTWLNREKGIAAGAGPNTPKIDHSSVKPEYITIDDNEYLLSEKYAVDFSVSTTWRNGDKIESLWYERVEADEFQRMQGKAPQMLLLDPKWSWPVENRYIIEAYPEFKDWIHDIKNYNWINNTPNPSYIHVRNDK